MGEAHTRQAGQGRGPTESFDCARGPGVICRAWVPFTAGRQLCLAWSSSLPPLSWPAATEQIFPFGQAKPETKIPCQCPCGQLARVSFMTMPALGGWGVLRGLGPILVPSVWV